MKPILLLLCTLSYSLLAETDFPVRNAVSVIIGQRGVRHIQDNIQDILYKNGVNLENIYFERLEDSLSPTATEDFVNDQQTQMIIREIKHHFQRFFEGLVINDHQLRYSVNHLTIFTQWDTINFKIIPQEELSETGANGTRLFYAELLLAADQIEIWADRIRLSDDNNAIFGQMGVNKLHLFTENQSNQRVYLKVPMIFYRKNDNHAGVRIQKLESNIGQIKLNYTYDLPLIFPEVALRINENEFKLKVSEIDNFLAEEKGGLLDMVTSALQEALENFAPDSLEEMIDEHLANGFLEVNPMQAPGAPTDNSSEDIYWGINLNHLDYQNNNLQLNFDGIVYDPKLDATPQVKPHQTAQKLPNIHNRKLNEYDLSFGFNLGFINTFIKSGFIRDYLKTYDIDENDKITFNQSPVISWDQNGRLKMVLDASYHVPGLSGRLAVRNPLQMNFELYVRFLITEEGKVGFVIEELDLESVSVDRENFKWPFRNQGMNSVTKRFEKAAKDMPGSVLAEEIPIPESLMGLDLKIMHTDIDPNGYLMIYTNYDFQDKEMK